MWPNGPDIGIQYTLKPRRSAPDLLYSAVIFECLVENNSNLMTVTYWQDDDIMQSSTVTLLEARKIWQDKIKSGWIQG